MRIRARSAPVTVLLAVAISGCAGSAELATGGAPAASTAPAVATVTKMDEPVGAQPRLASDPAQIGADLVADEQAIRDPATAEPTLVAAARRQQAAYRAIGRHQIGLVVNIEPKHLPPDATDADRHAARLADAYMNRQYLDPALLGTYPEELREVFGEAWPD